jgi:hypothetical protein
MAPGAPGHDANQWPRREPPSCLGLGPDRCHSPSGFGIPLPSGRVTGTAGAEGPQAGGGRQPGGRLDREGKDAILTEAELGRQNH